MLQHAHLKVPSEPLVRKRPSEENLDQREKKQMREMVVGKEIVMSERVDKESVMRDRVEKRLGKQEKVANKTRMRVRRYWCCQCEDKAKAHHTRMECSCGHEPCVDCMNGNTCKFMSRQLEVSTNEPFRVDARGGFEGLVTAGKIF